MRLFHRQRLLLNFLSAAGGTLGKTDFQKLLFLYSLRQKEPSYQFVPYRFGCFSFMTYSDRDTLIHKGALEDVDGWALSTEGRKQTNAQQVREIQQFLKTDAKERGDALITRLYREHPYYATRSEICDRVLTSTEDRQRVKASQPQFQGSGLLSIGYEGDDIDGYLNRLIRNQVDTLVDVRRNPLSRKHGFSKRRLTEYCHAIGIAYLHVPQLGIPSHRRRQLETRADYDALFAEYREEDLPQADDSLAQIEKLLASEQRPALTCFEKDPEWCHRFWVVEAITQRLPDCPPVNHI